MKRIELRQNFTRRVCTLVIGISLLASASPLLAEGEATPVSQLISPDRRHIAYGQTAVGPNGDQKVRIIVGDADGSHRRALPIDADSVGEVQWYGNDRLAYVTQHGEDGYRLINLEGQPAGEIRMPPGCDSFHQQCLAPDGKTIAYCGNYFDHDRTFDSDQERRRYPRDRPEIEQKHGLFLVDLQSRKVKQVLDETVANLPRWSPDSKYLACGIGQCVKDYPLVIIERETGKVHRREVTGTASGWSHDSKRLAIVTDIARGGSWYSGTPLDGAIGVLDVAHMIEGDDHQIIRVSPPPINVSTKQPYSWSLSGSELAVWSPEAKWLAYRHSASTRRETDESTNCSDIWIVQPDGTNARKVLSHAATELAWADERTLLWVNRGQFGSLDVELDNAASLGPTPHAPQGQFTVVGQVTDGDGRPLEGVEVRAATGIGSLHSGPPVKTDTSGRYELHFGPGVFLQNGEGPNLQAATIFATKPGHYERDLCQHGKLGMAKYRPEESDKHGWNFKAVVYPGHPYKLDFVMLPAAAVSVRLINPSGDPLADFKLELTGEELYPSTNIFRSIKTNSAGVAEFSDVPLEAFWFSLGQSGEVRTKPIEFSEPQPSRYLLIYDDIAGTLTAERH